MAVEGGELSEGGVLSEGEVLSGSESGNEAHDDGLEPGPAKKQKLDKESLTPGAGVEKEGLTPGASVEKKPLSKRKKRILKKQQKKQEKLMAKKRQPPKCKPETLNRTQVAVLQALVQLSRGHSPDNTSSITLKTRFFQKMILHLLLGTPSLPAPLEGIDSLREKRLVVIWLSLVSEQMFTSSDLHFEKLKSLSPCFQFNIEHPGSARFVRLGIEAFMLKSSENEDSGAKGGLANGEVTRASCLLSLKDLRENTYPIPPLSSQELSDSLEKDLSEYFKVTDWPTSEIKGLQCTQCYPMFAVDCEMVETKNGLELARVSIVNESLKCIYDKFVKPECPIMDYKTKFSGIDEDTLKEVTTTLSDVHTELGALLPPDCILVGHSLENDFHALKLVHPYVIDTSCLFTPHATPFSKPPLRMLTSKLLQTKIQGKAGGHSSVEDASACMELVLLKLRKGASCTVVWNEEASKSILTEMKLQGRTTGIVDKVGIVNLFGANTTLRCIATNDEAVTTGSRDVIPQCDFTFLQLHAMEALLKSVLRGNEERQRKVIQSLDSDVISVVEGCPSGSLVFVVCGSSDIHEVKRLYQQQGADEELQRVVREARTGRVVAFLVN